MKKLLLVTALLAALPLAAQAEEEKVLNLYNWTEYMPKEVLKAFTKETGIKVKESNYAATEEMYSKLKAGGGGYDLVVPSTYFVQRMAREGLDAAYYFAYQGVGNHGLLDEMGTPRPTFYSFRMINSLKGHFVEASSDDKDLWVSAVQDGKKLSLIVINTSTSARSLPLKLAGWSFAKGEWFDQAIVENEVEAKSVAKELGWKVIKVVEVRDEPQQS